MGTRGSTDIPLTDVGGDKLEIKQYAEGLARFISRCETPMNIGVQGEWGSGKTSLMKLVQTHLEKKSSGKVKSADEDDDWPPIIDYWFETWQYGAIGNADVLGVRLLQDLVLELREKAGKDNHAVIRQAERLLRAGAAMAPVVGRAFVAGSASKLSGGSLDGATLADGLVGGGPAQIGEIRSDFAALVKGVVERKKKKSRGNRKDLPARVVVFVDDLDRIRPGRAVALLEILKNFMDVEDTVFVVACDYAVVREGVKELMGIEDEEKVNAFFHKIFQVPFQMPIASYSVTPLMTDWLRGRLEGGKARASVVAARFAPLVEAAVGTNPRAFKRFLNTVELQCSVDESYPATGSKDSKTRIARWSGTEAEVDTWLASLLGMFALQTRWEDIAAYLLYEALAHPRSEVGARRFERGLRTLTGDWAGWEATAGGGDSEQDPDEQFQGLLRRKFGGPKLSADWRQHREMEELAEFAGLWFAALDRADREKRGHLDVEELSCLWRWTRRLVGTTKSTSKRRGKWAFHEEVLQRYPKAGDAFRGLCDGIESWAGATEKMSYGYNKYGLTVGLESGIGKQKNFMTCSLDSQQGPLITYRAARKRADNYFNLAGLEKLGVELGAKLRGCGFEVTESHGICRVPFAPGHKDGDVTQMDAVMRAYKLFMEGAARLEPLLGDISTDETESSDESTTEQDGEGA